MNYQGFFYNFVRNAPPEVLPKSRSVIDLQRSAQKLVGTSFSKKKLTVRLPTNLQKYFLKLGQYLTTENIA